MIHRERPAPAGLEDAVSRLWYLEAPRLRRYEKILPLPFVHLIVNLSEPYALHDRTGAAMPVSSAFVSGIQDEYLVIESPPLIRHVGVELLPGGLGAITDAGGPAVARRVQDARAVVPGADELVRSVVAHVAEPERALDALTSFIRDRTRGWRPDAVVQYTLRSLREEPDRPLGEVARGAGVSHRTLIARFRAATGLTPRAFAQVDRFHRFVGAVHEAGGAPDWTALTGASRYYDQPHVIRAFRRFCGWTPTEYHRRVAEFGPDAAHFVPLDELPGALGQARS
ncbi:helix-turn-helix domain-containing protein [Microbacterium sp.]|uniref:helix-turn-helix domain-containing protein n=1 Tax=Microbacterium sp. TaxID=51671 RepID=UPI0039E5BAC0